MNSTTDPKCEEAFSLIRSQNLPHPLGKLLSSFIANALNPALAAAHVFSHCRPGQHRKADLHALISDWEFVLESSEFAWMSMQHPGSDHHSHKIRDYTTCPRQQNPSSNYKERWKPLLHHRQARKLKGPLDSNAYYSRAIPLA